MSPGPGGPLSVAGFRVAARRAAILVAIIAIVIAVGILRLRAQEIGYVAALAAGAVALVVAGRSPRPGARRLADLRWWGVYVLGFMSFALIRTFADDTGIPWQYGYVIDIERLGGVVPTVWMQDQWFVREQEDAFDVAMFAVYISYFIVPQLAGILIWRSNRTRFRLYVAATLVTFGSGLLISFILPTAPPWLAGQEGHLPQVFRVIVEVTSDVEASARDVGYALAGANPVGAMPSLHMGITVVVALAMWAQQRALGVVGALYALTMGLALVYLGEHYVVDLLAGAAIAVAAWLGVSRIPAVTRVGSGDGAGESTA